MGSGTSIRGLSLKLDEGLLAVSGFSDGYIYLYEIYEPRAAVF